MQNFTENLQIDFLNFTSLFHVFCWYNVIKYLHVTLYVKTHQCTFYCNNSCCLCASMVDGHLKNMTHWFLSLYVCSTCRQSFHTDPPMVDLQFSDFKFTSHVSEAVIDKHVDVELLFSEECCAFRQPLQLLFSFPDCTLLRLP